MSQGGEEPPSTPTKRGGGGPGHVRASQPPWAGSCGVPPGCCHLQSPSQRRSPQHLTAVPGPLFPLPKIPLQTSELCSGRSLRRICREHMLWINALGEQSVAGLPAPAAAPLINLRAAAAALPLRAGAGEPPSPRVLFWLGPEEVYCFSSPVSGAVIYPSGFQHAWKNNLVFFTFGSSFWDEKKKKKKKGSLSPCLLPCGVQAAARVGWSEDTEPLPRPSPPETGGCSLGAPSRRPRPHHASPRRFCLTRRSGP